MRARERVERVMADPSDSSLVSLVTQICSFSAVGTTERERDREIESTFPGSGAETNREQAQGANTLHLQWHLAATVVDFFQEEMGSLICIMQHSSCNAGSTTKFRKICFISSGRA